MEELVVPRASSVGEPPAGVDPAPPRGGLRRVSFPLCGCWLKGLYVFVLGVGVIRVVGLGRVFVSRFVYPSEWDISIRCDHDMRKCRMVYVERFSRRDAERLGLSFDRVVEATRRVFELVADLYASNVF